MRPGRVLLRKLRPDEQTRGGIILPDQARESLPVGQVLLSGVSGVPVGRYVFFPDFAGTPVTRLGQDILSVDDKDILMMADSL